MPKCKVGDRVVSEDGYNGVVYKTGTTSHGIDLVYFKHEDGVKRCRTDESVQVCVRKEDMQEAPQPKYKYYIVEGDCIVRAADTYSQGLDSLRGCSSDAVLVKVVASLTREVVEYE